MPLLPGPQVKVFSAAPVLELFDVTVCLPQSNGHLTPIVTGANLRIDSGEIVGLVGASGAGKTSLARAILGTLPRGGTCAGQVRVMTSRRPRTRCPIAYIDQDPAATLNPVRRVGGQIVEVLRRNQELSVSEAQDHARQLIERLSLPASVLNAFPHQLSGGQLQRAAIARAIACDPVLVIADEPGSALDVVTQLELIDAFVAWRRDKGFGVLLISHETALIDALCERVVRLEDGCLRPEKVSLAETVRCA